MKGTTLEQLLAAPPVGVSELDDAGLRSMRARYQEVESGVSYLRRIVQGRLDLVASELELRSEAKADADAPADTDEVAEIDLIEGADEKRVVGRLAGALGQHGRGPGLPRPPLDLQPPAFAAEMLAEIDSACPMAVGNLQAADSSSLEELATCLQNTEQRLTSDRRTLHAYIDEIQAEIVNRYRSGAMSADAVIPSD